MSREIASSQVLAEIQAHGGVPEFASWAHVAAFMPQDAATLWRWSCERVMRADSVEGGDAQLALLRQLARQYSEAGLYFDRQLAHLRSSIARYTAYEWIPGHGPVETTVTKRDWYDRYFRDWIAVVAAVPSTLADTDSAWAMRRAQILASIQAEAARVALLQAQLLQDTSQAVQDVATAGSQLGSVVADLADRGGQTDLVLAANETSAVLSAIAEAREQAVADLERLVSAATDVVERAANGGTASSSSSSGGKLALAIAVPVGLMLLSGGKG